MAALTIHAKSHDYDVLVERGVRHKVGEFIKGRYASIFIITDEAVEKYYLEDVKKSLNGIADVSTAVVPQGESSKSMRQYEHLLNSCAEAKLDRKSLIIALGGGMVGDLAGFVASTYLRGVDYMQMPTTILAHDSSVGGKVAINHPKGKNLIGCFYNPEKVIYDIETIETLSEKEIRSGYGEVVKHAMLSDDVWFNELLERDILDFSDSKLESDLTKGIQVKAAIVQQDEREMDLRRHLNLGHTLAHAIETELGYGEITHGEAVAIGLLFTLRLSESLFNVSLPVEEYLTWLQNNHYPLSIISELDTEAIVERMKWDKKTVDGSINFVLIKKIGDICVEPVPNQHLSEQLNMLKAEVSGI
ncbi:3-dehydroquinate synthase [Halobacillus dabanensis]|uniref:3-dehydroquinate synthase n=1 Tax=Halobacillus dabanensis TaxID=240302 RepID=A0A1I3W199_HALDA|nr:3-dehydroquinate synthase [Halobacillus dabanensis]SFK00407.1 3-dehydroquinate synthase [Halobacillus dabanensis]